MSYKNNRIILAEYTDGLPSAHCFASDLEIINNCAAEKVIIKNHYLSADPAQKGYMSKAANYARAELGEAMHALAVGEVVESRSDDFAVGEFVTDWFGWQVYAHVTTEKIIRKVDPDISPIKTAIGALGISGLAAYIALHTILEPGKGQTLVISTAAGAVGSIVGQLAKNIGCRVIGITSTYEKAHIAKTEFGYDEVVLYQSAGFASALAQVCPHGIDAFFDNTGGHIADTVFPLMNNRGRIAQVGTTAIQSWDPPPVGPRKERLILIKELRCEGFIIFNHTDCFPEAIEYLGQMLRAGELNYREDIYEGLGSAPDALISLYKGSNRGKTIIRLS